MPHTSDAPRRIEILDSLRGFAALWVCWFHACIICFPGSGDLWWSGYGYLGVPIFYVISGFVIPYTLQQGGYSCRNFGRFFLKRTARLHPPFLASIAAVVLVGIIADRMIRGANFHYEPRNVLLNSLLIAPWFGEPWMLKAYWSLAVEIQWYIFAAVLFAMYSKAAPMGRLTLFVLVSCCLGAVTPLSAKKELLLQYLPLFSMGVVAFRLITDSIQPRHAIALLAAATACGLYRLGILHTFAGLFTVGCIVWIPRGLGLLNALGKVSYSLYLIHGAVLIHCRFTIPSLFRSNLTADRISRMLIGIILSIVAACCLYWLAEKPSQALSHRIRYK